MGQYRIYGLLLDLLRDLAAGKSSCDNKREDVSKGYTDLLKISIESPVLSSNEIVAA